MRTATLFLAALSVVSLGSVRASATPQVTSALSVGGGLRETPSGGFEGAFSMALRADTLFGPRTPDGARVGPFVSLRSDDFRDLGAAAGLSTLLPLSATFPLVLSAGFAVNVTATPVRPALLARLWWGTRSYNYHSVYGLAFGVWVEAQRSVFVSDRELTEVFAGVDIDLEVFALPVSFLVGWSRR